MKLPSVKDIMSKSVTIIGRDQTILEAARLMKEKGVGSMVVMSGGTPVGILTERDIVRKVVADEKPLDVHIYEVMSTPLITIDPEASLKDASREMTKHRIRRLPVLKDGKLLGMLTTSDFAKHLNKKSITEEILEAMSRYPPYPTW